MQNVLIVSGTNRPQANALRVARVVQALYAAARVPAEVLDLKDLPPEAFAPETYATKPAGVRAVQEKVLASAGLHVVVPEYNGSFPGVLKYFIDLLKFPESFEGRPVAFVGEANGEFGALRAVEQLQLVFGYRNAYIYPNRVFIPRVNDKFDAEGRLIHPEIQARLAKQAEGFARFIACVGGSTAAR